MKNLNEIIYISLALFLTTILSSLIIKLGFTAVSPSGFVNQTNTQVWVHRMIQAESNNRSEIVVFDSNHRISYGCAQFQRETFEEQVRRHNLLPDAEPKEYLNFIRDCTFQRHLSQTMIDHNPENYRHWLNTSKKINRPIMP